MYKFGSRRVAAARVEVWKKIDYEEFVAFIGLTLLAGGEKKLGRFRAGTYFRSTPKPDV